MLRCCVGGELSELEEGRDIMLVIGERGAGVRGKEGDCMHSDCMRGDERTDCKADADGDTCVQRLLRVCQGVKTEDIVGTV